MKTKLLLSLLAAGLLSACSTPPALPPVAPIITVGDTRYLSLPVPVESLKVGDYVVYWSQGQLIASTVQTVRAAGVYRVEGPDLRIVSASNFAGRLFSLTPR